MINENQLKQLLSDLESDRVERTVSTSKTDKFAETVCAFANDFPNHSLPGYLLIGVDNNGMPSRLKVTDDRCTVRISQIRLHMFTGLMTISKFQILAGCMVKRRRSICVCSATPARNLPLAIG